MSLEIRPLTMHQANEAIDKLHRHHSKVRGCRFCLGAYQINPFDPNWEELVGVLVVGRPVARKTDQYQVAEVTRLATDGTPNACSFLLGAAARACKAMGFYKIQTFILESETGVSLRATGWKSEADSPGGRWERKQENLPGFVTETFPTVPKVRYGKVLRC